MFFKEKFSQFSDLRDLSKYSFEQLKALVLPKYHLQTQQSDDILIATWKDRGWAGLAALPDAAARS